MLILAVLSAIAIPSIVAFRTLALRRGRRRNADGRCAVCGSPWAERYPAVDQFVVGGQYVCEPCGTGLRRRLRRGLRAMGLVSVGVAGATLLSNGFDMFIGNRSFAWWPLLYWVAPVSVFGAIAAVGAWRLNADNRAALAAAHDDALRESRQP